MQEVLLLLPIQEMFAKQLLVSILVKEQFTILFSVTHTRDLFINPLPQDTLQPDHSVH